MPKPTIPTTPQPPPQALRSRLAPGEKSEKPAPIVSAHRTPGSASSSNSSSHSSQSPNLKRTAHAHKSPGPSRPGDEEEDGEEADTKAIPLVTVIEDAPTATLAADLLTEADEIKKRHSADDLRLKDIRSELSGLAEAFSLPGLRYGNIALVYSGERTTRKLDVKKLIENGVDPQVINDSYTESKPYTYAKLIRVKRSDQ